VDDVACHKGKVIGNGFNVRDVIDQLAGLPVVLGSDPVRIGIKEGSNESFQVL
jgi:hypothetical protein